jgi:hypothetical protein
MPMMIRNARVAELLPPPLPLRRRSSSPLLLLENGNDVEQILLTASIQITSMSQMTPCGNFWPQWLAFSLCAI